MQVISPLRAASLGGFLALTFAGSASGQRYVSTGDIVVAADRSFAVMSPDGATRREFPSSPLVSRVLWDPLRPDSFVCANAGSQTTTTGGAIYRKTFRATDTVETTTILPLGRIGRPAWMAWDLNLDHIIVWTLANQIHRVDVRDGVVQDLLTSSQPWGSRLAGIGFDRQARSIYVVDDNPSADLYRYDIPGRRIDRIATGGPPGGLLLDPARDRCLVLSGNSTLSAVPYSNLTDAPCPLFGFPGTPATPTGNRIRQMAIDHQGNYVLTDYNRVYRLVDTSACPTGGTAPRLVGQFAFPARSNGRSIFGVTVVGGADLVDRYSARVRSLPSGAGQFGLVNAPPDFALGFLLLSRNNSGPFDRGSFYGLEPDALTLATQSGGLAPGNIFAHIGSLPPPLQVPANVMQLFSGETWDCIGLAFDANGEFITRTNLARVTWP